MIFRKDEDNQQGAIMVEATIYVPLVMFVVLMLIYYGLFMMQKYMLAYEANRVAIIIAREEAYLGYEEFNMGEDNQIDFNWGESTMPSTDQVSAYYNAYGSSVTKIYREIGDILQAVGWGNQTPASASRLADAGEQALMLAVGTVDSADIDVDYGIFGTKVVVTIGYGLPTPGVLRYFGLGDNLRLTSCAYSNSVSGSSMVRNVNLAVDLFNYVMEKFGLDDNVDEVVNKVKEIIEIL